MDSTSRSCRISSDGLALGHGLPTSLGPLARAFSVMTTAVTPPEQRSSPSPSSSSDFAKARTINNGGHTRHSTHKTSNRTARIFTEFYNPYSHRLLSGMVRMVNDTEKAEDITATAFNTALGENRSFSR